MKRGRRLMVGGIGVLALALMMSPAAYAQGQTGTTPHKKHHTGQQHKVQHHKKVQHHPSHHTQPTQ